MRNLLLNIFLLCSSIILTLFLLEALFRIVPVSDDLYNSSIIWGHWKSHEDMPEMYNRNYVYDNLIGYEKKEVYEEIKKVVSGGYKVKILILGDSVTEQGLYVNLFRDLIASRYNDSSIVIINAGVTGYDTKLEYNYLKYRGLDLEPDLVIIQFNMNDFQSTPVIIKQKEGSWLALDGNRRMSSWISPKLFAKSKAYSFITVKLLVFSKRKSKEELRNNVAIPLSKMKALLEEHKIPFYLIIFPLFSDSNKTVMNHSCVLGIAQELNMTSNTIDLKPYCSNIPFEKISKDPYHPNEEGGRIAATALGEKLIPFLDGMINETKNL